MTNRELINAAHQVVNAVYLLWDEGLMADSRAARIIRDIENPNGVGLTQEEWDVYHRRTEAGS